MDNPFGPDPAAPPGDSGANPFQEIMDSPGPQAAPKGRSYLAASGRAAMQNLASTAAGGVAGILEGPGGGGFVSPKRDLMELYKRDPAAFDRIWNSPIYYAHRLEEQYADRAVATMADLSPGGKKVADQSYNPFSDKPYIGGERLAGDVLQSGAQTLGTAITIAGAASRGPRTGAIAGAVEGGMEGMQTRQQVRQELEAAPPGAWEKVPQYQSYIRNGYHPEMARRRVIEDAAREAGNNTAVLSGMIAASGGALLGHADGGGILRRFAMGGLTELPVEVAQSSVGQINQNLAARDTIDPKRNPFADVSEAAWQGGTVGFAQGGAFNAALGRRRTATEAVANPSAFDVPERFAPQVDAAAAKYGVPRELLASTFYNESRWQPNAFAKGDQVGTVNPATGLPYDSMGLGGWGENWAKARGFDPRDPNASIEHTAQAYREYLDKYGQNPLLARLAYGWGPGNVDAWIKAGADPAKVPDGAKTWLPRTAYGIVGEKEARAAFDQMAPFLKPGTAFTYDGKAPSRTVPGEGDPSVPAAIKALTQPDTEMLTDKLLKIDSQIAEREGAKPAQNSTEDLLEALGKTAQPKPLGKVVTPAEQEAQVPKQKISPAAQELVDRYEAGQLPPTAITSAQHAMALEHGIRIPTGSPTTDLAAMLQTKANTPVADPALALLQEANPFSLHDTGMSEESLQTREDTYNPNDHGWRENKPVQFGPAAFIGKPIREAALRPGEVITAAIPYEGASREYMQAVHDTVQKLIRQFAPTARVIITHETGTNAVASQRNLGDGWYHINPRNFTRSDTGVGYNQTANLQAAFSLAHEIGHTIVDQEFMRGLTPAQQAAIESLPSTGYFDEQFLQSLPEQQQRILREYNDVKRSLLDNPRASARDFILRWLSPWKTAHGFDQARKPEEGWKRYAENKVAPGSSRRSARDFALMLEQQHPGILGVHEYLAEQFARYAENKSQLNDTALGASQWFAQTLARLQAFFSAAKLSRLVAPSETFARWLTRLTEEAPRASARARRTAIPVETLSAAEEGLTRFDEPEALALRDQLLFGRDASHGLPEGQEFFSRQTGDSLEIGIGALQPNGEMQRSYALDVDPSGKITFNNQVTQTYPGLGPALVDYARSELASRGQMLDEASVPKEWQGKEISEAARREALTLLDHGQDETAKEVVERSLGVPRITRWDGGKPGFGEADAIMAQIDKLPPARSATRSWLATGMRRAIELGHAFLDIRQVAANNPHVLGLRAIAQSLTSMQAYRGTLENSAMGVAKRWRDLSKVQANRLSAFMDAEYGSGQHAAPVRLIDDHLVHQPDARFAQLAKQAGLSEQTARLFLDIKNEYMQRLGLLQKYMRQKLLVARDAQPDRSAYYNARMQQLAQAFDAIRAVPFHPQTRFGQYVLEVRRPGAAQPFHVEAFESAEARADARSKVERYSAINNLKLNAREVLHDSHQAVMRVLPVQVLDAIGLGGTLTPSQRTQLFSSLDIITRSGALRKYSPTLGSVTGASKNQFRVFSDFMHNDALMLSKLAFRQDFTDGLNAIKQDIAQRFSEGDEVEGRRLESLHKMAGKSVKQILNPAAEWHALRSFVVWHDLWANIKSAVANLTGLVNTWAIVTKRLGTVGGTANFSSASARVAADRMTMLMQKVLRAPTEGWAKAYNENERWGMEKLTKEGLVDETAAAQMAGWANAGTLERMGMSQGKRILDTVMRVGMQPLQIVEQYTRRVTFLTMFDAYLQQGLQRDLAYRAAVEDMLLTQGDNSILNRAEIMRGKKSAFLIYYNYMRNMTYLMSGGYTRARMASEVTGERPPSKGIGNETMRMWLAYFALGGLMGLPGAEDLDKIIELIAKQLGFRVSVKELAYELARDVTDNAPDIGFGLSPRQLMHGLTSAIPLPGGGAVDISTSVGLGNAIPGLGGIDKLGGKNEDAALTGALGPLGRRVQEMLALFKEGLPWEKQYALAIPSAVANIIKAVKDEPRFYSGGRVLVDPRTGEVKDLTTGEMLMQMAGFAPADVSARQELYYMQKEFGDYWMSRRNGLMAQVWEARLQHNQDAIHDAMKAVREFNSVAPAAGLRITSDTLSASTKRHLEAARRDERGQPNVKGLRPGYRQLQDVVLGR